MSVFPDARRPLTDPAVRRGTDAPDEWERQRPEDEVPGIDLASSWASACSANRLSKTTPRRAAMAADHAMTLTMATAVPNG